MDGHYSWIQVISSFIYHVVFFGVSFSFGIFYVELLDEFPGSESEAGECKLKKSDLHSFDFFITLVL